MNKIKFKLPFIVFIVGIIFLLLSYKLGYYSAMFQTEGKGIIISQDSLNILIILSVSKYICLGFVLSLLGGLGIIKKYY